MSEVFFVFFFRVEGIMCTIWDDSCLPYAVVVGVFHHVSLVQGLSDQLLGCCGGGHQKGLVQCTCRRCVCVGGGGGGGGGEVHRENF